MNQITLFPMNPQPRPHAANPLRIYGAGFILLLLTSCSSVHKLTEKSNTKQSTIDKSISSGTTNTQTTTTEKADTTITIKSDTARISFFLPNVIDIVPSPSGEGVGDEADQSIESGTIKITIHSKPVYTNGKKTGTTITATAIKKADSVTVKIDRKIITNATAQTNTKNDIIQKSNLQTTTKQKEKKGLNLPVSIFICALVLSILIIIFVKGYRQLKKPI